jgi:hypothetical protein
MKLPKRIIKKYGISKKAWSVFKRTRKGKAKPTIRQKTKRVKTMARRRRTYATKKRTKRSGMNSRIKTALAVTAYATLGEPLLDKAASQLNIGVSDDIVKGGAGLALDYYGKGWLKAMGKAAWIIALNRVATDQIGNVLDKFGSSKTISNNNQNLIG